MDVDVLVVGSVNEDVAVSVERLPGPGETLLASDLAISCGGKGANQAVAAARDGVRVAMAGAVGDDEAGRRQAAALDAAGVDTRWLPRLAGVPTGTAFIQVDTRGENTIVVAQGANARAALPAGDVEARVIVTQNEIPQAVQRAVDELATRTGARLVVNAAPAPAAPPPWYGNADPLVVNEHEAAQLAASNEAGAGLLHRLRERTGARSLVMTLGERGALVNDGTGVHAIPPVVVERVVDATGAGDTFVGVLAARLARGEGLVAAACAANRVAAQAVTWQGARPPAGGCSPEAG
ncbi:ribokinase [[Pseudopropionibacterium] massiliense]|uniref:ribokinase n=1 Tax=[Pseudopropionibacterium] massiliense TaxID=2220000 RepID=UPI00102F476A|nr:ribokinase [[Pseudopropionibacterium] massiliense]